MTVHAYLGYPETARKSLEEIDHIFDTPAWRTKSLGTFDEKVREVEETGGLKSGAALAVTAEHASPSKA